MKYILLVYALGQFGWSTTTARELFPTADTRASYAARAIVGEGPTPLPESSFDAAWQYVCIPVAPVERPEPKAEDDADGEPAVNPTST